MPKLSPLSKNGHVNTLGYDLLDDFSWPIFYRLLQFDTNRFSRINSNRISTYTQVTRWSSCGLNPHVSVGGINPKLPQETPNANRPTH